MNIEKLILKHALKNAYKHEGKCLVKSVISGVIGEEPKIRSNLREIIPKINEIVDYVNSLTFEEIEDKIKKEFPEILEEKPKEEKKEMELPGNTNKIVVRFSPNPSGPLHLGHSRVAVLNDYFAKKYKGKYILRLEDTDPKRVLPEAYEMIKEDLDYLKIKVDEIIIQSQRMETYYEYCEKLIKKGKCYICNCDTETFKKYRDQMKECPCRSRAIEENLELWNKMLNGELDGYVVRLKTDMKHKNQSLRDFPIFRIEKTPHPLTKNKYYVYPLMNFSVPIDDHLLGITHVIRGKDHILNTEKQKYIYEYFGWKMPEFIHIGIMKIEGIPLSTSKMYDGIKSGIYDSWEDIRLGTLKALKKRGILSESIREFMLKFGLSQRDIIIPVEDLYKINKTKIDKNAKRVYAIFDPAKIKVKNCPETKVEHKLLNNEYNLIKIKKGDNIFVIEKEYLNENEFRLKDLFNIKKLNENIFEFNGFEIKKSLKKIEWLYNNSYREIDFIDKNNKKIKILVENIEFSKYMQMERKFYVFYNGKEIIYCHN